MLKKVAIMLDALTKALCPKLCWLNVPNPSSGDFWISSDYECHCGMGVTQLPVALPYNWISGNQTCQPLFWQGSEGTCIHLWKMAVKENITSHLFLSSLSYSNVYIHSSDEPLKSQFLQNDKLKGCEKQDCTTGFTAINPFARRDFAEKRVLTIVERFSGHCRAIQS